MTIQLFVNSANKYFVLSNIIALLSTVNHQSIYNDKNWHSVYYYGLMSILAGDCKYVMNAVEIPHDFTLLLMIWPSHLETKPNPNRKKQPGSDISERIKPNRTRTDNAKNM